jgi:hypothetical protein
MTEGSPLVAALAAFLLIGGLLLERLLISRRWMPYFTLGFPLLGPPLVPIPKMPLVEEGRTASVRFDRVGDVVRFWSDPADRTAPMGLRGLITLVPAVHGVYLDVRWAPPWSPLFAAAWLAGLGIARGEARLTVPIACVLIGGVLMLYAQFAVRVAAEMRWALVKNEE